jgi:hypothetical protein
MKDTFLEVLHETTLNNTIQWSVYDFVFSDEMKRHYECYPDSNTKVRIEINLKVVSNQIVYEKTSYIRLENENFVKKSLHFTKYDNPIIDKIGEIVFEKYIKPNIKPIIKTDDDILQEIISSMPSKQVVRDNNLKKILDN